MSKKIQRIPYTFELTLASGDSYSFEIGENVECRIEKQNDNTWNAEIMYVSGLVPTVLTYETTGIETSDTALKFSVFNDTDKLTLKNNEGSSISLYVTRKA
jgi:hypothetical protein